MEKLYILLAKDRETGHCWVEGVFDSMEWAAGAMGAEMDLWEEARSYKIEEKFLND